MRLPSRLARLIAWFDNPDPRLAAAGTLALLIAANQPFYPIWVWLIVGAKAWPALLTFLSMPFFLAVPALSRRNADVGRWVLIAAAIGGTALSAAALGPASRVELFYLPCLALVPLIFAQGQRRKALLIAAAAMLAGLGLARLKRGGLEAFTPAEIYGLAKLHAFGVAALLVAIVTMARRFTRLEVPAAPPAPVTKPAATPAAPGKTAAKRKRQPAKKA